MAKREIEEINAGSTADIAFLLVIFFLITTTMIKPQISEERLSQKSDVEFLLKQENVLSILAPKPKDKINPDGDSISIQGGGITYSDGFCGFDKIKDAVIYFYEHKYIAHPTNKYLFLNNENVIDPNDPSKYLPFPSYINVTLSNCNDTIEKLQEKLNQIESLENEDPENPEIKLKEKFNLELVTWEKNLEAVKIIGDFKVLPMNATVTILTDNETKYDTYMQVLDHIMQGLNELRDKLSMQKFNVPYDKLNDDRTDPENTDIEKIQAIQQVYPKRIMKQKQASY